MNESRPYGGLCIGASATVTHWSPGRLLVLALVWCGLCLGVASAQTVAFDPAESVPTEPVFSVNIEIDCAGQAVKGVELKVAFDPFLVRLEGITAGPWFTGSGQAHYFYDYTNDEPQGVIHLASAVLDGTLSGIGTLAVCHFTILDFGTSPLIFQSLDVRGLANIDLGFAHSTGDRIILDPVVGVEAQSFGAVKLLFR